MLNVSNNQAKKINSNTRSLADGITKMPFFVPQFKDGGEVSLKDRLPTAYKESGNQARQLRYNVQNPPGKTYIQPTPKPDPYAVKVGPQSDYRFQNSQPPAAKLGPTVVDSQLVGNVANSLANSSTGPYKEKLQAAFPPQNGQSREGSLAQKILGYKDGGPVDPMLEKDEYGMIEGPGTGTSDDIPAELTEGDYIIPAQAVQTFGEENLMRLIHAVMGNEMMEGEGEPVDAMVSNGEIRVPPEVVEKLGVGFFDAIRSASGVEDQSITKDGKPAYAFDGFVDDETKRKIQEGANRLVGGVEQGASLAATGYNDLRGRGYGVVPAATIEAQRIAEPLTQELKKAGNAISNVPNYLFNVPDKAQAPVTPKSPEQVRQSLAQQNQPNQSRAPIAGGIGKSIGYDENGLRTDSAPQTLYWGEQRFSNSGDVAKDQAIEARQQQIRNYNDQREASIPEQASSFEQGPKGGYSLATRSGGFTPQASSREQQGIDPDTAARLAQDQYQFDTLQSNQQQEQINKRKAAQFLDIYRNDKDEGRRREALKRIAATDYDLYTSLVGG